VDACRQRCSELLSGSSCHHVTAARLVGATPQRLGTAQHNFAPYEAIRAADGLVMVGVNSDRMWRRFCEAVGCPALADDDRYRSNAGRLAHRSAMVADIECATADHPAKDLVDRLSAAGIPASQVRPVTALVDDPQVDALGLWGHTADGLTVPRVPTDTAAVALGSVPRLGQHTADVLQTSGLSQDEIDELVRPRRHRRHGLIAQPRFAWKSPRRASTNCGRGRVRDLRPLG
jgi:CoA:oxalate CoA-transferase